MSIAERATNRHMNPDFPLKALLRSVWRGLTVVPVCLALLWSVQVTATTESAELVYEPVSPTVEQARANILIARQLQFTHFRDMGINEALSEEVFDAYLDYLDGQRVYLSQNDVDRFSAVRESLGSALKTGQL